jgi:hypothetical protein
VPLGMPHLHIRPNVIRMAIAAGSLVLLLLGSVANTTSQVSAAPIDQSHLRTSQVSAAPIDQNHFDWNYQHSQGAYWFTAWSGCPFCFPNPFYMQGFLDWNVDRSSPNYPQVTLVGITNNVPVAGESQFSMEVTVNDYVYYNGWNNYYGDIAPPNPNGNVNCAGNWEDTFSCSSAYWYWYIYHGGNGINFSLDDFVQTHDDFADPYDRGCCTYHWT